MTLFKYEVPDSLLGCFCENDKVKYCSFKVEFHVGTMYYVLETRLCNEVVHEY